MFFCIYFCLSIIIYIFEFLLHIFSPYVNCETQTRICLGDQQSRNAHRAGESKHELEDSQNLEEFEEKIDTGQVA